MVGCTGSLESCVVEITRLCNDQSDSRKLQTSNDNQYQLDFEVIESFTCEKATCNSNRDQLTTSSIVAGIATPILASLDGDEFLTILSENIIKTGSFSADIVTCFAVWGKHWMYIFTALYCFNFEHLYEPRNTRKVPLTQSQNLKWHRRRMRIVDYFILIGLVTVVLVCKETPRGKRTLCSLLKES